MSATVIAAIPAVARLKRSRAMPSRVLKPLSLPRTHISRAMGKLGARDRAQLVVFAVRAGLVLPEEESIVHDRNDYPEQGSCQGVWSPDGA